MFNLTNVGLIQLLQFKIIQNNVNIPFTKYVSIMSYCLNIRVLFLEYPFCKGCLNNVLFFEYQSIYYKKLKICL